MTETRSPPAGLRILVVDDEAGLCEVACVWLRAMGHVPVSVQSPAQALERLAEGFDVLFTDVVMPGPLDGVALAREALRRSPGIRVLITTGYAQAVIHRTEPLPGPVLHKPYRKPELAAALASLF